MLPFPILIPSLAFPVQWISYNMHTVTIIIIMTSNYFVIIHLLTFLFISFPKNFKNAHFGSELNCKY